MNNSSQNLNDFFLTSTQAAKYLNVSLVTLKKFISSRQIKALKTPGGHYRIHKNDLLELTNATPIQETPDTLEDKISLEISKGLVHILEKRQKFCRGHADLVAKTSLNIAQGLNFPLEQQNRLRLASLLHDIGMLNIDSNIPNKKTGLSDKEYSIIKTHPLLGEEIMNSIHQFKGISVIIRQHHERYDGQGYPDGIKKGEIFQEAAVITLAEAFASMTAVDSYKKPLSQDEAIKEIERNSGTQFDPEITEAFLRKYKE